MGFGLNAKFSVDKVFIHRTYISICKGILQFTLKLSQRITAPTLFSFFLKNTVFNHTKQFSLDSFLATTVYEGRNVLYHYFFLSFKKVNDNALSTISFYRYCAKFF